MTMRIRRMEKSEIQLCHIRIMFPVNSDEQAIEYKKKIAEALSELTEKHIDFSLTAMPPTKANAPSLR